MHIIGTYNLSYAANEIVYTYKGYTNVPCVLYSISIFVFIKNKANKIKKQKIIDNIGKHTFSIYLMHWYFIRIITGFFDFDINSLLYRIVLPICIVCLCIIVSYILRKIPIINKIVP